MKPLTTRLNRSAHRQRGAVAILLGLTLAVLIGFAGLAIDLGRFFVIKTELQNAMDACALSASTQLRPGQSDPNALTRAIAYGRVFSTGGVPTADRLGGEQAIMNRLNFQDAAANVQAQNVTFSSSLNGPYLSLGASNSNTAAFVQCSLPLEDIPIFFFRVLNPLLNTQTVSAQAVATLASSQSTCAIPVGVCRTAGGTVGNNFGLTLGQWLTQPAGSGSVYGTGNFGWIDFSPPAGGANEVAGLLEGSGQCALNVGAVVGQAGNLGNAGERAWNTRFGVYQASGSPLTAAPDRTGVGFNDSNWPSRSNAYAGSGGAGVSNYIQSVATYSPYQGPLPQGNVYNSISSAQHQAFNQLRRVAVAPVVNCDVWNTGGADPAVEGWACVLMLHPVMGSVTAPTLEFLGLSSNPGSPCATTGQPGTFGPLVPQLVQ